MNRRNFLSTLLTGENRTELANDDDAKAPRATIQAGLEPFATRLTRQNALHLVRRLTFTASNALVNSLVGKTASEAVDIVLGTSVQTPLPPSPGAWTDETTENPDRADLDTRSAIRGRWGGQFGSLQNWWANLMLREAFPAREKVTLFWSGHFTSEFSFDDTYNPPQLLYRQNQMLRNDALGDIRQLTEDITLDGAMLNYLGGNLNSKGSPNENYARELMELFTTGIGAYTEGDVKEASRVLTGWRISRYNDEPRPNGYYATYFVPTAHDVGAKQVLGVLIPPREADANTEFQVRTGEVRRLVNIIFEQRADTVARFLSREFYRFFVYSNPSKTDETVITQMADVLKQSNFTTLPLLKTLFTSAHFFDEANVGVQIKTPVELVIGLARQLGVNPQNAISTMNNLEQTLQDPPNVAGWDGYRTWLSTKTYPLRVQYVQQLVQGMSADALVAFAKQFPQATNADALTRSIEEWLLPKAVSTVRHQTYLATLLAGAPDYEWSSILGNTASAATRIKSLLLAMAKAPDMQLC
jgi:uncharacterized protein (DUF1800 family)